MAIADRPGGLYYRPDGVAVDADGNVLEDAPKRPTNTDPSQQPGALGAPTPEERMGRAIAQAIVDPKGTLAAQKTAATAAPTDEDEDLSLPVLSELEDHLAGVDSVADVKAMQKADERVGAQKWYEKRIAELEAK